MKLITINIPETYLEAMDDLVRRNTSLSSAIIRLDTFIHTLFDHSSEQLESLERIIRDLGFNITANHEVLQTFGSITYRVNLVWNIVHAEINSCYNCPNNCKMSTKLCIQAQETGFSTIDGLVNLRMIAILLAIREKTLMSIKGTKPQFDLSKQISALVIKWKHECLFIKKLNP